MHQATIYVVIVNWNGKKQLQKCLTSFFAKDPGSFCEVVVVDNASADGSVELVQKEFPQVRLIENVNNEGFSKANNQGIRYALLNNADYVLLLNNDIEIAEPKWLETMVRVFAANSRIGIVGCKLLFFGGKIQHAGGIIKLRGAYHRGEGETDRGQFDRVEYVDYVTGAALLIKKDVIQKIGFLDEGYSPLYFEDTDWCVRAFLYGFKIAYTPHPALIHHCGVSASKLGPSKKNFYYHRSFVRFVLLNFQLKDILKRFLRYESLTALACLFVRTRGGKVPIILRNDASTRLSLFIEAWMPSVLDLKKITILRRQRFIFGRKINLQKS